jgi:hypothetical protein
MRQDAILVMQFSLSRGRFTAPACMSVVPDAECIPRYSVPHLHHQNPSFYMHGEQSGGAQLTVNPSSFPNAAMDVLYIDRIPRVSLGVRFTDLIQAIGNNQAGVSASHPAFQIPLALLTILYII